MSFMVTSSDIDTRLTIDKETPGLSNVDSRRKRQRRANSQLACIGPRQVYFHLSSSSPLTKVNPWTGVVTEKLFVVVICASSRVSACAAETSLVLLTASGVALRRGLLAKERENSASIGSIGGVKRTKKGGKTKWVM